MGRHSNNSTPDTPEQNAAWLDASYEASQARAEAKREADPIGEAVKPLTIKGQGDDGRGGNIGISADGSTASLKRKKS